MKKSKALSSKWLNSLNLAEPFCSLILMITPPRAVVGAGGLLPRNFLGWVSFPTIVAFASSSPSLLSHHLTSRWGILFRV